VQEQTGRTSDLAAHTRSQFHQASFAKIARRARGWASCGRRTRGSVIDADGLVVVALRGCRTDGNNKHSRNKDSNCTWNVATAGAKGGPHMREPYSMMKDTTTKDGKGRRCSEVMQPTSKRHGEDCGWTGQHRTGEWLEPKRLEPKWLEPNGYGARACHFRGLQTHGHASSLSIYLSTYIYIYRSPSLVLPVL
jgi:hypothetical protein